MCNLFIIPSCILVQVCYNNAMKNRTAQFQHRLL
uniref:Uncharacterized protein n=1 Tax=Phage sp. ctrsQ3 TaxID=2826752 RepID=A0A8S5MGM9_9VIRU|nr:MAG TPA: hypothetical protein [Phage sp. ctrsQ3]